MLALFKDVNALEELYQHEGANTIFERLGFNNKKGAEDCYNMSFMNYVGDDEVLTAEEAQFTDVNKNYIR